MDRNVFLAILSMDSYNRGYGSRIKELGDKGTKIGNSVVGEDAQSLLTKGSAEAAGFYAIAYDWTHDGKTERVISYRGTDNLSSDAFNSYAIGAGNPYNLLGTSYGAVVGLTVDFYKAVVGAGNDPFAPNAVTLTGHSLGGGLAGYIAGLYGQHAVIFDNMTFNAAGITVGNYGDTCNNPQIPTLTPVSVAVLFETHRQVVLCSLMGLPNCLGHLGVSARPTNHFPTSPRPDRAIVALSHRRPAQALRKNAHHAWVLSTNSVQLAEIGRVALGAQFRCAHHQLRPALEPARTVFS